MPIRQGGNGQDWVLARPWSAYVVLDGAAVPSRKRAGFVDMALRRWAPFADPASYVEWVGDKAMVWAWSRAAIQADDADVSLPTPRRVYPESLHRGQPMADGEELVAMDEGVEGRAWRDGVLVASGWWPALPALPDWNEFRRGAGLLPTVYVPEPQAYPLLETPWTGARAAGLGESLGRHRRVLLASVAGLAAAALATLAVACIALKVSTWQVEREVAEAEQAIDPIIRARDHALAIRSEIEAELALRPVAGQMELLGLANRLMRGAWQLQEWKVAEGGNLQLTARMTNPDPRAIVSAWEGSGRFADVTAEIGQKQDLIVVKARALHARPATPQQARK